MAIGRALFGNTSSQTQSKNLVEFRAGKMDLKGTTVTPDKRKGLVYIHQTDDSLMHFCWKDRTAGSVVDDLIIFPDDVEYKRVPQCTTGRVYVLKFKSTNRKLFFWMQEPKTDKDDEYCKKVNEYLNNPPALGSSRSGGSTPGGLPSELSNLSNLVSDGGDIQTLLNNMSQQQLMQLFGNVGGMSGVGNLSSLLGSRSSATPSSTASSRATSAASTRQESAAAAVTTASTTPSTVSAVATTTAASTATTVTPATTPAATPTTPATVTSATPASAAPSSGNIQLSDLQSILSGISIPTPASDDAQSRTPIDLSTAINVEALQPVLNNPEFLQRLQSLIPQGDIPSSQNLDQVRETLQSPQFQQAISMFSAGLQSGQLGPLMQQFGLPEETIAAAAQGDMDTFVRALQESIAKQNADKDGKAAKKEGDQKPKKDDDDEDMALG